MIKSLNEEEEKYLKLEVSTAPNPVYIIYVEKLLVQKIKII